MQSFPHSLLRVLTPVPRHCNKAPLPVNAPTLLKPSSGNSNKQKILCRAPGERILPPMVSGVLDSVSPYVGLSPRDGCGTLSTVATNAASKVRFAVFEFDLRTRELRKYGRCISLQDQPGRLLALLLSRPGEFLTRDEIRRELWPDDVFVDYEHGVHRSINKIREALADSAEASRFIETRTRAGYRFSAPVELLADPPVQTAASDNKADITASPGTTSAEKEVLTPTVLTELHPVQAGRFWGLLAKRLTVLAGVLGLVLLGLALRGVRSPARLTARELTHRSFDLPVSTAAISPDGERIVFADAHGVFVRELSTEDTHPVAVPSESSVSSVAWFPDSTRFAATTETGCWMVSILGGQPLKILDQEEVISVSPDGSQIAYADNGLWIADIGEKPRLIVKAGNDEMFSRPAWSPDGSRLASTHHWQGPTSVLAAVETYPANGGSTTTVYSGAAAAPWWLPDGRMVFPNNSERANNNLWVISVSVDGRASSLPAPITQWAGFDFLPGQLAATSNGRRMSFVRREFRTKLLLADFNKKGLEGSTAITDSGDAPVGWTPDGKGLLLAGSALHLFNLQTRTVSRISDMRVVEASLTADGGTLLYSAYEGLVLQPKPLVLKRIPVEGGPSQTVLHAAAYGSFRCPRTPGVPCVLGESRGNELVFTSFDPMGGDPRQLAVLPFPRCRWELSPDGTEVAIWDDNQARPNGIRLVEFDRPYATRIARVPRPGRIASLVWTPDGRGLLIAQEVGSGGQLTYLGSDGQTRKLWADSNVVPGSLAISPDGKRIAFSNLEYRANAWLLENF
jgi:DNA-binding winged helix-turn-helix (wHTH) protein/Tol biopolymer transport system component